MQSCTTMLKTLLQIIENNSFIVLYTGLIALGVQCPALGISLENGYDKTVEGSKDSYKYLSATEMKGFRNQALWRNHKGPMETVYKYLIPCSRRYRLILC